MRANDASERVVMRISEVEKQAICQVVHALDPDARIYLFGSRTDDKAKGGDIDLLILSGSLSFADKLHIKKYLFEQIGEQKIDIVISQDTATPFVKHALQTGVRIG